MKLYSAKIFLIQTVQAENEQEAMKKISKIAYDYSQGDAPFTHLHVEELTDQGEIKDETPL